jgi:hypothetical protein
VNLVGTFLGGTLDLQALTLSAASDTSRGFLAVLDANDGTVVRANAFGDDGTVVQIPLLSFGPTGFRILAAILIGPGHFGDTVIGSTTATNSTDSAYVNLIR